MPTIRKRYQKRNERAELTEGQVGQLVTGCNLDWHKEPDLSRKELRQAWEANREFIMAQQGEGRSFDGFDYGERPFAWWIFEAPEPRRIVGYFQGPNGGKPMAIQETEADYIDRLDLWLPGEREKWEAQQAEIEKIKGGAA